jgi:hypothetical protein
LTQINRCGLRTSACFLWAELFAALDLETNKRVAEASTAERRQAFATDAEVAASAADALAHAAIEGRIDDARMGYLAV